MTRCWVLAFALLLQGCATTMHPVGILYTDVESGVAATSSPSGVRQGQACATSVLGLVALGDMSVETARKNGAVSMVTSVDVRRSGIPVFYTRYCTIVRGR